MCELYEESERRIECEVGKSVFDVIFYGGNDGIKHHDFGNVYCCKNVRKCRTFTILERDVVKFDDGSTMCQECASKIIQ